MLKRPQQVILFDGVCNFCNASVNFIIDHDREKRIHFASIQSEAAQAMLRQLLNPTDTIDSIIFIDGDQVYKRSSAVLRISRYLSGLWKLGRLFLVIPRPIRDFLYNVIARNRYKWFGKRESCRIPTPDLQDRFLS